MCERESPLSDEELLAYERTSGFAFPTEYVHVASNFGPGQFGFAEVCATFCYTWPRVARLGWLLDSTNPCTPDVQAARLKSGEDQHHGQSFPVRRHHQLARRLFQHVRNFLRYHHDGRVGQREQRSCGWAARSFWGRSIAVGLRTGKSLRAFVRGVPRPARKTRASRRVLPAGLQR